MRYSTPYNTVTVDNILRRFILVTYKSMKPGTALRFSANLSLLGLPCISNNVVPSSVILVFSMTRALQPLNLQHNNRRALGKPVLDPNTLTCLLVMAEYIVLSGAQGQTSEKWKNLTPFGWLLSAMFNPVITPSLFTPDVGEQHTLGNE